MKLINALKEYDFTEKTQPVQVSFSKEFEEKMDRFITRKKRTGKIILITQRAAVAAIVLTLAGSWLYLMMQQNPEGVVSSPGLTQGSQDDIAPTPEQIDNIPIGPKNPQQPTGRLIIRNEEVGMGHNSGLRRGIPSWEEAHREATFDLTYPVVLPERTYLHFIDLLQMGENGSYPCAGALLHKPMIHDTVEPTGVAFLYFFQYYLGNRRDIEFADYNEVSRPLGLDFPGETWKYLMQAESPETFLIDDTEVIKYLFFHTDIELYKNDIREKHFERDSKFLVLHWIQNDVLFRIVAPIFEINYGVYSFTLDDLLPMAEGLIRGE